MIELTTTDLLAKIGALTLQVEALTAENQQLRERVNEQADDDEYSRANRSGPGTP